MERLPLFSTVEIKCIYASCMCCGPGGLETCEEPRDVNKIDIVLMDHVLSELRRDIGRMVTRLAMSTEKLKARSQ